MTKTEEIKARAERYNRVSRATDSLGRVIGVKRLRPSQALRVQELAPGLDGTFTVTDPKTGKSQDIPNNFSLMIAAAVVEIDGNPFTFPKNRAELNAVLDELDNEGISAAFEALGALEPDENKDEGGEPAKSVEEMAKN